MNVSIKAKRYILALVVMVSGRVLQASQLLPDASTEFDEVPPYSFEHRHHQPKLQDVSLVPARKDTTTINFCACNVSCVPNKGLGKLWKYLTSSDQAPRASRKHKS